MNTAFWKAAAERAIKTFAQSILALLGTGSVGITTLDWKGIASVAATAALASILTSLASLSTVTPDAPAEAHAAALEVAPEPVAIDAPATVFPAAKVEAALAAPEPVAIEPIFTPSATPAP